MSFAAHLKANWFNCTIQILGWPHHGSYRREATLWSVAAGLYGTSMYVCVHLTESWVILPHLNFFNIVCWEPACPPFHRALPEATFSYAQYWRRQRGKEVIGQLRSLNGRCFYHDEITEPTNLLKKQTKKQRQREREREGGGVFTNTHTGR